MGVVEILARNRKAARDIQLRLHQRENLGERVHTLIDPRPSFIRTLRWIVGQPRPI